MFWAGALSIHLPNLIIWPVDCLDASLCYSLISSNDKKSTILYRNIKKNIHRSAAHEHSLPFVLACSLEGRELPWRFYRHSLDTDIWIWLRSKPRTAKCFYGRRPRSAWFRFTICRVKHLQFCILPFPSFYVLFQPSFIFRLIHLFVFCRANRFGLRKFNMRLFFVTMKYYTDTNNSLSNFNHFFFVAVFLQLNEHNS